MVESAEIAYKHLLWKSDVLGRKGPYLKETNVTARVIAVEFFSWYKGTNYEKQAVDRGLPIAAIKEAVDWFLKNPDIAEHDATLERRV